MSMQPDGGIVGWTTRRTPRLALALAACASLAFAGLAGCEESAPSTKAPTTPDNPSTALGKSAKMARDTEAAIGQQQAAMEQQAGEVGRESLGELRVKGLTFKLPAGWQRQNPSSTMRLAELSYAGADGGAPAQAVFFVLGGSAADNIARWKGQMQLEGQAKEETRTVNGIVVTTLTMEGTYRGMTAMGGAAPPQPGTRFVGVILEGPEGPVQIRLTGPVATVRAGEASFMQMISGIGAK